MRIAAFDDLQCPATCIGDDLGHLRPLIAGIGEDALDEGEYKEDKARWSAFLNNLEERGLDGVRLGDVDVLYVWRFLRAQKIDLAGRKSWWESNDPEFVAKDADAIGLYMAPPENAIVICLTKSPRSRRWSMRRGI